MAAGFLCFPAETSKMGLNSDEIRAWERVGDNAERLLLSWASRSSTPRVVVASCCANPTHTLYSLTEGVTEYKSCLIPQPRFTTTYCNMVVESSLCRLQNTKKSCCGVCTCNSRTSICRRRASSWASRRASLACVASALSRAQKIQAGLLRTGCRGGQPVRKYRRQITEGSQSSTMTLGLLYEGHVRCYGKFVDSIKLSCAWRCLL